MNDSLNPVFPYSTSPFAEHNAPSMPPPNENAGDTPLRIHHKKLARLRESPTARLLAGSPWVLKAYQLDMDCPPPFGDYIDRRLTELLQQQSGNPSRVDGQTIHQLSIEFSSDTQPAVDPDGSEHHSCRLSLSQFARSMQAPESFLGLIRHMEADRPLSPEMHGLTLRRMVRLIMNCSWEADYRQLLETFWSRYKATYQLLARLAFLDGLDDLRTKRRITHEGYALALDALGLEGFPADLSALLTPAQSRRSVLSLVSFNDQIVPGVFQLKSTTTSHCFIHVLGDQPACVEYISSDSGWQTQPLLSALNTSAWHRQHLQIDPHADSQAELRMIKSQENLFDSLTQAQQAFSLEQLESPNAEHVPDAQDDSLLMPIQRALSLISALDIWSPSAPLQSRIPDPLKTANRMMGKYLQEQYGLKLDPEQVFIRYQPGKAVSVLGHARAPVTNVQSPDDTPLGIGQALISQYRIEYPVGYVDEGGGAVVYLDPDKKGEFREEHRLPVPAQALEQHIQSIDFLQVMTRRLQRFWEKQGDSIAQSLQAKFVSHALLGLKNSTLSRQGFDTVVHGLEALESPFAQQQIRCSALGFFLQRSVLQGAECLSCAGLLVFSRPHEPGGILYQAGQDQAFVEFSDRAQLSAHLVSAAGDPHWRRTVQDYAPLHLQQRLGYILELWGKTREPIAPASLLRPWTDRLYNEDAHFAQAAEFCEQPIEQSPFSFMRDTLRNNSLSDAQDSISTAKEVTLLYWTDQLLRLQRLLAPLSLLLPPATLAALLTSAATLVLNAQSAALPGLRDKEKNQLMLTLLSFGLLQLGPLTPGLSRALRNFTSAIKPAIPPISNISNISRSFTWQLGRSMNLRQTQLERFFGNGSLLKTWTVPGYPTFATFPVKAWKLERKFILWTSDRAQARTLVVSTHGYYLPWSRTTAIPNGTELRTYVPHGFELIDPRLHRIVSQKVQPLSLLNNTQSLPGPAFAHLPGWQLTDKALAGTSQSGRIKNYTLAKFQSERYESYRDISNIVRHSHQSPFFGQLMPTPMDVFTVRNRFGMSNPSLHDLFSTLSRHGIHYDHILLVHCRCSAVESLLGRAPGFIAPTGSVPITP